MSFKSYSYFGFTLLIALLSPHMTFDKINTVEDCDCLLGAEEDVESTFVRFLAKGKVRENDFLSKWEKNQTDAVGCEKICGKKGISLSKINDEESKDIILQAYSEIFDVAPAYKAAILVFKFNDDAGVVKPTPRNWDKLHHDLYKSDAFAITHLNQIEVINFPKSENV